MTHRHAARRRIGGRAGVAALLVLGVAATGTVLRMRSDAHGDTSGGPNRPTASSTGPSVPDVPTGAPQVGMYVATSVLPSGDVEVRQWVNSRTPLTSIDVAATAPQSSPTSVTASDLEVVGGGVVLAHLDQVGDTLAHVALSASASHLYLTYRLVGALDQGGTVAGRALLRVVSLDVDYAAASGPVRRVIDAPGKVLDVGCLRRDTDTPRPCGAPLDTGDWFVDLTGRDRDDRLVASIEMG